MVTVDSDDGAAREPDRLALELPHSIPALCVIELSMTDAGPELHNSE